MTMPGSGNQAGALDVVIMTSSRKRLGTAGASLAKRWWDEPGRPVGAGELWSRRSNRGGDARQARISSSSLCAGDRSPRKFRSSLPRSLADLRSDSATQAGVGIAGWECPSVSAGLPQLLPLVQV